LLGRVWSAHFLASDSARPTASVSRSLKFFISLILVFLAVCIRIDLAAIK
jgi:hypothetical protein